MKQITFIKQLSDKDIRLIVKKETQLFIRLN